jgi:hypothetical protein
VPFDADFRGGSGPEGERVRVGTIAAVAAIIALSACSGTRSRTMPGPEHPVVTRSTSLTPRPTTTPRSTTPAHRMTAQSTRLVIDDRVGDVLHTFSGSDDHPSKVTYPRADLRRVMINRGGRTIDVVAQFGDLQPSDSQLFEVQLRTLHRTYFGDAVLTRDDRTALSIQWEFEYRGYTYTLGCPEASGRVDFTRNLMVIAVPTNCLETPAWVLLNVRNALDDPDRGAYEDGLDNADLGSHGYTPRAYRR